MPGENLTRIEAQERAKVVSVDSYLIELDLTKSERVFGSKTTVKFSATGARTFIDAITDKVHSVNLNGVELDVAKVSDGTRIQLDGLAAENTLIIDADAFFMNTGEGLHRFVDPVDNEVYLYSQFEVPDSRRVYAVFEQPDLKANFTFHVTAPANWKVVSNQVTPKPIDLGAGKARWEFPATKRISSYITALIAGPYFEKRGSLTSSDGRTIDLGVFYRQSLAEYSEADYVMDITRAGFEFFERNFDFPYPFEKYDQLFVPEFNAGAMENAGAVTFTEMYVYRSAVTDANRERRVVTILHELAHMWFGDLVTMRWWNDLWLNESFAEYASHLATAQATTWKETWVTFASLEKSWAYAQDQLPSTHPIVASINDLNDVQVNFDGITYAKGGSVLKQLAAWVGQDAFLKGVSAYFKKHAFGNTELSDLLRELEAASGRDLSEWSKVWLETAGVNTLRTEITVDADGNIASAQIRQTADAKYPYIRPHRIAVGSYDLVNGKVVRTNLFETDVDGELTALPQLVGKKRPGLILVNDEDLAYAKIRLEPESLKFALENLSNIESPMARSLIWGTVWDTARDAEISIHDYINLVIDHIATETESTTLLVQLRQLLTASGVYVPQADRQATREKVGAALLNLLRNAAAGSDAQLQFAKFFALLATGDAQVKALADIHSGAEVINGLKIDTDLAWELLVGLAAAGHIGETEIAAALAADNTANGQKAAAAARATIAETKQQTWHTLTATDDYSNALVQSASAAFGRTTDSALLKPFVERYFAEAKTIWQSKTFKIAEYLLENLYPIQLASQELYDSTKKWLETEDWTDLASMKRIMVENLAMLERALKVQAVSGK